jgi:hypothetical protein
VIPEETAEPVESAAPSTKPDGELGTEPVAGPDRDLAALEELEIEHRELLTALATVETPEPDGP